MTTRYDATPEPASAKPVHLSASWALPGVAVAVPLVGSAVSRVTVALGLVAAVVVLPRASRRNTVTVFLPSPLVRAQDLVAANASYAVQIVVLDTHIWE